MHCPIAHHGISAFQPIMLAVLLAGCQSGVPGWVGVSDDGNVIAFRDERYPTVYVADHRGVRAVGRDEGILSRDGRTLLLLHFGDDNRATVYDIVARRAYRTALPHGVPYQGGFIFFEPGPRITIGLAGEVNCQSWTPVTDWGVCDWPHNVASQPFAPEPSFHQGQENIIVLGPDGWNARRTVWIRPDGSTLEILRHNDAPAYAAGMVLQLPILVFPNGLLAFGMAWSAAFDDFKWRQQTDHTREELADKIAEIRSAARNKTVNRAEP